MKSLRIMPFLRVVLPYILGIFPALYFNVRLDILWWIIPVLFLFSVFAHQSITDFRYRWVFGASLSLLMFTLGYQMTFRHLELNSPRHFSHFLHAEENVLEGEITDMPIVKAERVKVNLSVSKAGNYGENNAAEGNVLVYLNRDSLSENLAYGDRLFIFGRISEISPPSNPHAFDYRNYLHFQNIHYQAFIADDEWTKSAAGGGWWLRKTAFKARKKLLIILRKYLPDEQTFSVGSALILGYKDEMDDEVRTAYAQTGAMHVLAVSGLHVGLIYLLLGWLFDKIVRLPGRRMRWYRGVVCFVGIWAFALLTGLSPSVMRAATMFSVIIGGSMFLRTARIYNSLAFSAFLLLLLNPLLIMSVGFQLSYLAVTGIVYFQPKIYSLYICENKFTRFVWQLVSVSLAAQFVTLPLSLYYFHQFPVYFWLSGLIVVPAASVILSCGLLLFFLESISGVLGMLVGVPLYYFIKFINLLIFGIQKLPGSIIEGIWISGTTALLLYVGIAFLAVSINTRHGRKITYGMLILTGVFILSAFQKGAVINNRQVTVYDVYKNTLIDFISNGQAISLTNKELSERNYSFAVQNNHFAQYVNNRKIFHIENMNHADDVLYLHRNFIQYYDKRFYVLDAVPKGTGQKIRTDYLIIRGNPYVKIEELSDFFTFQKIIIDNSNSRYKAQKWREQCRENNLRCHYTAEDGAWVLNF